jgi:hypothetical protein
MAVRKNLNQTQRTRDKIRASQLVTALENHVLEGKEMSATQIQAAKILLGKVIPDVKQVELSGADGSDLSFAATISFK